MVQRKPLIGIVGKVVDLHFHGWTGLEISNDIRRALVKNGARTIGLLPSIAQITPTSYEERDLTPLTDEETADLNSVLDLCDGIVLEGGLTAYLYEEYIAQYAVRKDIPLIGICSGCLNMVSAFGGKIGFTPIQGSHNHPELDYAHGAHIDETSSFFRIVRDKSLNVNSIHQRTPLAVKQYNIVGTSDDNLVEVIEYPESRFNYGVAFHPEILIDQDEKMNNLFKAFISAASETKK